MAWKIRLVNDDDDDGSADKIIEIKIVTWILVVVK